MPQAGGGSSLSKCKNTRGFSRPYGGEEFAVILPKTSAEGATVVAKNISECLRANELPHAGSQVSDRVTLSVGVASTIPLPFSSPNQVIAEADLALYEAKN